MLFASWPTRMLHSQMDIYLPVSVSGLLLFSETLTGYASPIAYRPLSVSIAYCKLDCQIYQIFQECNMRMNLLVISKQALSSYFNSWTRGPQVY